jgi:hypothetical protein
MLIPLTQQTIHSCPRCLNKVGVRTFYDLFSLKDRVFSFKFGNFGILVTKKQLLGFFIFIFFSICFYLFFAAFDLNRVFIKETWEDFKKECGAEQFIKNNEATETLCHSKYRYSDVSWKGWVIRVNYDDYFMARHKLSILVKMENNTNEDPELYLKFSEHQYKQHQHEVFSITRGDYVAFNATIFFEGNSKNSPVLEAWGFEKQPGHVYIEPHIHHTGRYSIDSIHDGTIHQNDTIFSENTNLVADDEVKTPQHETYH